MRISPGLVGSGTTTEKCHAAGNTLISHVPTAWPCASDYAESVQNLHLTVREGALKRCIAVCDANGLPVAISGNFASVYQCVSPVGEKWALRLFLSAPPDHQRRYQEVARALRAMASSNILDFEYISDGIWTNGRLFPILKVQWIDGLPLDRFISQNKGNSSVLLNLEESFVNLMSELRSNGIAHGDLQHGNILVTPEGQLRLIDYDDMFVPALAGLQSNELGHRHYQHPARTADDFGASLDNFSSLVIQASIRCIRKDPSLLKDTTGGECLLFQDIDFNAPAKSGIFRRLQGHKDRELREIAAFLRRQLELELVDVDWCLPRTVDHFAKLRAGSRWNPNQGLFQCVAQDFTVLRARATSLVKTVRAAAARSSRLLLYQLSEAHRIRYNTACTKTNPLLCQVIALAFPPTWLMVIAWYLVFVQFMLLPFFGKEYRGEVTEVFSDSAHFQFVIDGTVYKDRVILSTGAARPQEGEKVLVCVGPLHGNDPWFAESHSLLRQRMLLLQNKRQSGGMNCSELFCCAILSVLLVVLEYAIWSTPCRHLYMAMFQRALPARIRSKSCQIRGELAASFTVDIEYQVESMLHKKTIAVTDVEFHYLTVGANELVYLDQFNKGSCTLAIDSYFVKTSA